MRFHTWGCIQQQQKDVIVAHQRKSTGTWDFSSREHFSKVAKGIPEPVGWRSSGKTIYNLIVSLLG